MLEQGYECIGVTLKLFSTDDIAYPRAYPRADTRAYTQAYTQARSQKTCCSLDDVNDARDVAYRLDMPHYVLNFAEDFKTRVINRFIETYEAGATPNPCIDCNRFIKFSRLLLRAEQLDFDAIATGHYARAEKSGSRYMLKRALDSAKDQSYVLYAMTQEQLSRSRFPLGELSKKEVRRIAEEQGFINARKHDSQDICFVPNGDYGAFIEHYTGRPLPEGPIIDLEGNVIGRHRGALRYTIGQRRGLGVAKNEPIYVASKSMESNTVVMGPESSLYSSRLCATDINLIACEKLEKPLRVTAKTRYLQKEEPATVEQTGDDSITVVFDRPQRAVTPGQAVVFYDGDLVIGGGTILPPAPPCA
jgi:tRNA-specific 2-thiouridylase